MTFSQYEIMGYPLLLNPLLCFCWKQDSIDSEGANKGSFWLLEGYFCCSLLFAVARFVDDGLELIDHWQFLFYLVGKEVHVLQPKPVVSALFLF